MRLNPNAVDALGLEDHNLVRVTQDGASADFAVYFDERVPEGCVWLPLAAPGADQLGAGFAAVSVEKV